MKPPWIFVFLILTALAINASSGNTHKEGVHVVESSFRPKITILRIVTFHDVSHPMVNLKNEDGKNKKSLSVNTTRVHKEVPNEPMNQAKHPTANQSSPRSSAKSKRVTYEVTLEIEFTRKKKMTSPLPQKKIRKSLAIQSMTEDIAPTNQTLLCDNEPNKIIMSKEQPKTNVSLQRTNFNHSKNGLIPRPKSLPNKQLHQRKVLPPTNNDTWFRHVWDVLYDGIVNVFGVNELRVPVDSINHNCYNWRKVTMSALDHPCPGYGCLDQAKYIRGSKSAEWSKPAVQDDTGTANTKKEVFDTPSLLRMPKDYQRYRLPVRMPSEANDKAMTTSLAVVKQNTDASDQNRNNSFKSPGNSAAHNSGSMRRTSKMANVNLAAVKYESRFSKKSRNVTRTLSVKKALETRYSHRNHGSTSNILKAIANWTWQDTFEMIVMFGIVDVCMMGMYCTTAFIKGLILLLGFLGKRILEKERERLTKLELAAQPKPWQPRQIIRGGKQRN